jgi:hypothetical protein
MYVYGVKLGDCRNLVHFMVYSHGEYKRLHRAGPHFTGSNHLIP